MSECCPLVVCLPTDSFGNPVCPYTPDAVVYAAPHNHGGCCWSVAIEGYVAVFLERERISPPLPFCIVAPFRLSVPKGATLAFRLESFHSWAVVDPCQCTPLIRLLISIDTLAFARKGMNLLVPQVDPAMHIIDRVCIYAERICDFARIHSESSICFKKPMLQAETSQYSTIADGTKRTFRNSDEWMEYGRCGILSPERVSYYHVFVNGVLQPQKNYILKKGELTFTTCDIPSKGQPVIALFVIWKNKCCTDATQWQFSAISDGLKKVYTNEDELPEYKSRGIPSPAEVSFFNLYVNGVLQPQADYRIKRGVLALVTKDAPPKGAPVILESVIIWDSEGRLIRTKDTSFQAYSNGGRIYTDRDRIRMYGPEGIPNSNEYSYQSLFVNGVLQPPVNYCTQQGYLILGTADRPAVKAPISLQSIRGCPAVPFCETRFSRAALARWKKEFPRAQGPNSF